MIKKDKNFLTQMTLESIKEHVKADQRGFHLVEFKSGNPILVEHGVVYVTTRMTYKFTCDYQNNKVICLEKDIYKAASKEACEACRKSYNSLSSEQQLCVSDKAMRLLVEKESKVLAGISFSATERSTKDNGGVHDKECPNIIHYPLRKGKGAHADGLMLYKSFQYNVNTGQYVKPETHYYYVNNKTKDIEEVLPTDSRLSAGLFKEIKDTSRTLAGKSTTSKTTLVRTPKIAHILTIDGSK